MMHKLSALWADHKRLLIWTVCCAYGITCLVLVSHDNSFERGQDTLEYTVIGQNLWSGQGILIGEKPYVLFPPGHPVVTGLMESIISSPAWAAKVTGLISHFLTLFLLWKMYTLLTGPAASWLALSLMAVNSQVMLGATNGYSEAIYTLVMVAGIYYVFRNNSLTPVGAAVLGGWWATLYLIRPEGLLVGCLIWIVVVLKTGRDQSSKALSAVMTVVVVVILIAPYLFFLRATTERWQISGKTYANLVLGELQSPYQEGSGVRIPDRYTILNKISSDPRHAAGFFEYDRQYGQSWLERTWFNVRRLSEILFQNLHFIGLAMLVWGIRAGLRNHGIMIGLLLLALFPLIFFYTQRFLVPFTWILSFFMALGFSHLGKYLRERHTALVSRIVLSPLIAFLLFYEFRSVLKILFNLAVLST